MDSMRDDLARELDFWHGAALLDRIALIIASNPRWADVAAQVAEHSPHLTRFEQQVEVKHCLIEADERGGAELARWFRRALS